MLHTIDVRRIKSYQAVDSSSKLHLVEVSDEISATFELLKILHQYNHQNGWTLLIAPDAVPSKTLLDSCSIDKSKLLVIRQKHLANLDYVLNSALSNGNFAAIITWTNMLSHSQLELLAQHNAHISAQLYSFVRTEQPNQCPTLC
ncbi:SulA-like leucine-rich domain-containing protein [Pseudoalteromonas tunicata]|jgi:cell division inhibitor SulA|uniref:Putative orphan protein n=1 Tax=Pseudoalteromonas tunicata D2 TaxID=87626 RepID=A4CBU4_9GAMM|nr:SulA-like leucine-rich domain-containing protein [Pseudoalteromonas tunicata]ATC94385.1 hypothetical protein PTUN_a1805 [Pseudoalteromonas tunicata]AXT30123.1 hypothetical protein D1819_04425 [Pseudoalteromonas tunicata]EAR27831.1 putative orphan protein [Pseudoalteromonas tunicata D2]